MRLHQAGRSNFWQPLAYIKKDYADTYKPYKSFYYLRRDLLQPFHGIVNIFKGFKNIGYGIVRLRGSFFTLGVMEIVRGLIRIFTTPLNWFLRIPLRLVITAVSGFKKAEESAAIQNAVIQGRLILEGLEECNLKVSEIQNLREKEKQLAEKHNSFKKYQTLTKQNKINLKADQALEILRTEIKVLEENLKEGQKKGFSKANEIAETIQRKFEKSCKRGQKTNLSSAIKPFTVSKNAAGKFETTQFIAGLKLFDRNLTEINQLGWRWNDNQRRLQPNRCA